MQETLDNALILRNLCEHCRKLDSVDYIFVRDSIGLPSTTFA